MLLLTAGYSHTHSSLLTEIHRASLFAAALIVAKTATQPEIVVNAPCCRTRLQGNLSNCTYNFKRFCCNYVILGGLAHSVRKTTR